jgi:hypothetical protein
VCCPVPVVPRVVRTDDPKVVQEDVEIVEDETTDWANVLEQFADGDDDW